jgi:hypothetical protein
MSNHATLTEDALRNFAEACQIGQNQLASSNNQHMVDNIVNNEIAIDRAGGFSDPHEQAMQESMDNILLEEFKKDVKTWLTLENELKRLREAAKLRREKQTSLLDKITVFMNKYNVGDLNTDQGVVSLKTRQAKKPLSQKEIRERVGDLLKNNLELHEQAEKIFTDREKVEKQVLRRKKL